MKLAANAINNDKNPYKLFFNSPPYAITLNIPESPGAYTFTFKIAAIAPAIAAPIKAQIIGLFKGSKRPKIAGSDTPNKAVVPDVYASAFVFLFFCFLIEELKQELRLKSLVQKGWLNQLTGHILK